MKILMTKVKVAVDFEIGEAPHVLQDTLFFTEEEYAALTSEQIDAMKVDRYQKWYAVITAPPVEIEESTQNPFENLIVDEHPLTDE